MRKLVRVGEPQDERHGSYGDQDGRDDAGRASWPDDGCVVNLFVVWGHFGRNRVRPLVKGTRRRYGRWTVLRNCRCSTFNDNWNIWLLSLITPITTHEKQKQLFDIRLLERVRRRKEILTDSWSERIARSSVRTFVWRTLLRCGAPKLLGKKKTWNAPGSSKTD